MCTYSITAKYKTTLSERLCLYSCIYIPQSLMIIMIPLVNYVSLPTHVHNTLHVYVLICVLLCVVFVCHY